MGRLPAFLTAPLPRPADSPDAALSLKEKVRRYEMALIREALDSCGGSMAEAARRLQVERSLLYKKMEKFGMK